MKRLDEIRSVYFVGIGGIGMSALARYFLSRGCRVAGYDRTPTELTRALGDMGAEVVFEDDPRLVGTDPDIVVYTPAIPPQNRILSMFRQSGAFLLKRSDVLGLICQGNQNLCIAGTHGKTTVSTMTAHILRHSGFGCNAFLGGIASNYDTNFWGHERRLTVIEADEYDRSFLKLSPDIAVITAMDADHLDIYGTEEAMRDAFVEFSHRTRPDGLVIAHGRLPRLAELRRPVATYDLEDSGTDIHASSPVPRDGAYHFDVHAWEWTLTGLTLPMGGRHNVENSLPAIAIAHRLGVPDEDIRAAIASFQGVRRRFEFHMRAPGRAYIDDYAHHPEELRVLIEGVRDLFPGRRLTLVFQPHLFSRTRDFAAGFAESLDMADDVLLMPIYPAREEPIPGVDAGLIAGAMQRGPVRISEPGEVLRWIEGHPVEVLVTAGAGDIDRLVAPIRTILTRQAHGA
ncbi:MAG: UDP-N-acetylmuramate--L-alanine ligase [Chitinophagia bacterium]|nr:UDP-N-acetylmuramate--L-alanine ligase [Chitinophagia bacterium]